MPLTLSLSPQVFAVFAALIESRAGLHYSPEQRDILEQKLSEPALEAGFESFMDYYYFLRYDPQGEHAIQALVNALLVHETYFFREATALRALVDRVLAPQVRSGQRPRVWSAACATGEEPLTLAMMLAEADLLSRVSLVATDLSEPALDRAKRGIFSERSLRGLTPEARSRWVQASEIAAPLRERIEWKQLNLVDASAVAALGKFDVILCRNVLIYFSDDTARGVVQSLASCLKPDGYLAVGASESLLRFGTPLQLRELGGAFFYRNGP